MRRSEEIKPREKLKYLGITSLDNAELMALLLGTGIKGKDVFSLSRDIIGERDIVSFFLSSDLKEVPGVGEAKLGRLIAVKEILRRAFDSMFVYWLWLLSQPLTCFLCGEVSEVSYVHCTTDEDFVPSYKCSGGWVIFHRHLKDVEPSAFDQAIMRDLNVRAFYVITDDLAFEIISKKTLHLGG
jgi:hypothetical protein